MSYSVGDIRSLFSKNVPDHNDNIDEVDLFKDVKDKLFSEVIPATANSFDNGNENEIVVPEAIMKKGKKAVNQFLRSEKHKLKKQKQFGKFLELVDRRVNHKPKPENDEKTLFADNVPLNLSIQDFKKLFSEVGKVQAAWFRGLPVPKNRLKYKKMSVVKKKFDLNIKDTKFGFVLFADKESVAKAVKSSLNGKEIDGHHLRLDYKVRPENYKSGFDRKRSVFVANIPRKCTDADLKHAFETCVEGCVVKNVNIRRDKVTGESLKFAFVLFEERKMVKDALNAEVRLARSRAFVFHFQVHRLSRSFTSSTIFFL
jgi:RNA recognition motif-containing protein